MLKGSVGGYEIPKDYMVTTNFFFRIKGEKIGVIEMKYKILIGIIGILLILGILLVDGVSAEDQVKIYGYVTDESGNPVKICSIAFHSENEYFGGVSTDESGYFEKYVPKREKYLLCANPEEVKTFDKIIITSGYLQQVKIVEGIEDEIKVDFTLKPGGTLWIKTYDLNGNLIYRQDIKALWGGTYPLGTFPSGRSTQNLNDQWSYYWGWDETSPKNIPCFLVPENQKVEIWAFWNVPLIGDIFLNADNDAQGFTVKQWDIVPINLVYEFARTEYRKTREKFDEYTTNDYIFTPDIVGLLDNARDLLQIADTLHQDKNDKDCALISYEVLKNAVKAKEELTFETAKQDIEKFRKKDVLITLVDENGNKISNVNVKYRQINHDFIFGVGWPSNYEILRDAGFEYASTQSWWGEVLTSGGEYNFFDERYESLMDSGFKIIMHTGEWIVPYDRYWRFYYYPEFILNMSESELNSLAYQYSYDVLSHYGDKIKIYDAFNEPMMAIALNLSSEQMVNMVRSSVEGAEEANPDVNTYVNFGGPIFGWMSWQGTLRPNTYFIDLTAEEFVSSLIEKDVGFDSIGLEFYYGVTQPTIDVGTFSETLDHYARFGKEVFVSELSYGTRDDYPEQDKFWYAWGWHEGHTDKAQADWAQYTITIAFSKPFVNGIMWVGANDGPADYDFAGKGLFHRDGASPRPIVFTIKDLISNWTTEGEGKTDKNGEISFRGFAGEYEVVIDTPKYDRLVETIHVGEGETNDFSLTLTSIPIPDFALSVSPTSDSVVQSGSTTTTVTISPIDSYDQTITLSASGAPSGVNVDFNPSSGVPPFDSTMTVSTSLTTLPDSYTLTITGTGADGTEHSTTYTLEVNLAMLVVAIAIIAVVILSMLILKLR